MNRHRARLFCAATIIMLGAVSPVLAQNYDTRIDNGAVSAAPLNQPVPLYPGRGIRAGQEGWVAVNFVITPDDNAIDPIILDSSGGREFEESTREIISKWRFEAPGELRANNTARIRFEIHRGKDLATSNFLRRSRRIVTHLFHEEFDEARTLVDQALKIGGWNLYESTMLWLMVGRVEGAEGNSAGKLECYRRALGMGNSNALDDEDRRDLLSKLFELEIEHAQYASAKKTIRLLKREPGSQSDVESLQDKTVEMERALAAVQPMVATATVFNASNSEEGEPIWSYVPARRTFSFAALSGNVERFEVRCERDRLQGLVEVDKTWSMPANAGNCQVFVFGDDGASFQFVEHSEAKSVDATGQTTVAKSDVLD